MAHPEWCGKACEDCSEICELDSSMPCSPDCDGLDESGEPSSVQCALCDSYAVYKDSFREEYTDMETKDIKSMPNAELLNNYVIAVMNYEINPTDKDNKMKMLDMNFEILSRMEK